MNESIFNKKQSTVSPIRKMIPGEDKRYILLIKCINSDETYWEMIKGRLEAYNYIKENIEDIDIDNSYIIVHGQERINFDNMHNLYLFMKDAREKNNIEDGFDIDDYSSFSDDEYKIPAQESDIDYSNVFTGVAGSFEDANEEE